MTKKKKKKEKQQVELHHYVTPFVKECRILIHENKNLCFLPVILSTAVIII
jgi:hypothetical protein